VRGGGEEAGRKEKGGRRKKEGGETYSVELVESKTSQRSTSWCQCVAHVNHRL
jgi:hypothetical protein